jgi:hypothetical protein
MELKIKSIFELEALHRAIEDGLDALDPASKHYEQDRDYLLTLRSRVEELMRIETE